MTALLKEVSAESFVVHETTGPRHFTKVLEKQTFGPDAGLYAGKSYAITTFYVSPFAGHRGQFVKSTSSPWKD